MGGKTSGHVYILDKRLFLVFLDTDFPSTICRTYPGEMGIALHYREFHWAQRGRRGMQEYIEYFED